MSYLYVKWNRVPVAACSPTLAPLAEIAYVVAAAVTMDE
jgi:hypothetical protein